MWVGDIDPDVNIDIDVPELKREIKVVVDDAAKLGAEAGRHAAEQARHELEHARESLDQSRHEMMFLSDGSLYKLRMGTINPELGRYFGTDTGVLVLDKDRDSMAALKPGDVIVGVAGKQVATPSQVMRGLRSGTPGASVNVEIMRDKKRQVVAVDVPEHGPMLLPIPPEPPEPPTPPPTPKARLPVPPAPPAAPAAPAPPTPPVPPPHPPGEATTI
jgi:hypothetical protein